MVLAGLLVSVLAPASPAQVPVEEFEGDPIELPTYEEPSISRPLTRDSSILSLLGGQRLLTEADGAIAVQDYANAEQKLQEARRVFNQLSNFYQQLSSTFSGIDNRISDDQRRTALETAQLRDQATYDLALVHIAQSQPDLAVPLLIQIVRSQNPTTNLGRESYQRLFEIGFVEAPLQAISDVDPANGFGGSSDMLLSQAGGDRLLARAGDAISAQDYTRALEQLQEARQVFNQLSNFYQELAGSFSGIDGNLSETLRRSALRTAESRDEATYQLALVHRAQDQSELAVPLLIQIVRSQNPTSPLGRKAYQQLFELGFVQTPYPRYQTN
ncbi:MAG: hypothetical protein HC838_08560 [Spirulinaceae cyanobacterium RM2_2_10]|nr:hypothetical protein [Spirulinaceae cyanobacterium RM2_2_10]